MGKKIIDGVHHRINLVVMEVTAVSGKGFALSYEVVGEWGVLWQHDVACLDVAKHVKQPGVLVLGAFDADHGDLRLASKLLDQTCPAGLVLDLELPQLA